MAVILTLQDRMRQAQAILKDAVETHAFLRERSLLVVIPEEEL